VLVHRYVDAGYAGHLKLTPGREKRGKISQFLGLLKAGQGRQPCRCLWRLSLQIT
jgi:hypothetical protein